MGKLFSCELLKECGSPRKQLGIGWNIRNVVTRQLGDGQRRRGGQLLMHQARGLRGSRERTVVDGRERHVAQPSAEQNSLVPSAVSQSALVGQRLGMPGDVQESGHAVVDACGQRPVR